MHCSLIIHEFDNNQNVLLDKGKNWYIYIYIHSGQDITNINEMLDIGRSFINYYSWHCW